jgi:hypothetical protein
VDVLLKAKADPNVVAKVRWSSTGIFDNVSNVGVDERIVSVCLVCSIRHGLKDGLTPLHESSFQGSLQVIEMLLKADANPNATTARVR